MFGVAPGHGVEFKDSPGNSRSSPTTEKNDFFCEVHGRCIHRPISRSSVSKVKTDKNFVKNLSHNSLIETSDMSNPMFSV